MKKGLFITFEGTEGSGKSTQIRLLGDLLKKHRVPHLLTREPGGSRLSTQLRHWILNKLEYNLVPKAELFLFLADRAQHVDE
ncbi:MAG TPA: dTMP kinase, partial [bacterium]|nr:dTMP kinase [bacterium]